MTVDLERGLRGFQAEQTTGEWPTTERRQTGSRWGVTLSLFVGFVGVFLCLYASFFGMTADGEWLALPPDYTVLGWSLRGIGGLIGVGLAAYLWFAQKPYLSRRRSRSTTGRMARVGLALSLASVTWEFAVLGFVLLILVALIYALFRSHT